jgi:hypothetical protein
MRRLLSVWVVDRQWPNKHECYAAPASCGVIVARGTQLSSNLGRNGQDRRNYASYAMQHQRSKYVSKLAPGRSACMTEYLIAARAAIILWTTLAVMPVELVFDAIEGELERRGIEP